MTTSATLLDESQADPTRRPKRAIHASIEPLFSRLAGLCTLPAVALKVIQVADDDRSDATDLVAAVEQDAAIATRLIQVVNSSYCGVRREAADLRTAVTTLGAARVRNLAVAVSIGGNFARATPVGRIDPERLWDHSVCVATIARVVAEKSWHCNPDEAYLAGLVHDLGMLFVLQQLEELVPRVLVRVESGLSLCEAEREIMAFDHAQLGAYVAWRAGFPERLVTAIDYHHNLMDCPEEGRELTRVVALGNYLATRYGRGSLEGRRLPAPTEGTLRLMGLDLASMGELWEELPDVVSNVSCLTGF